MVRLAFDDELPRGVENAEAASLLCVLTNRAFAFLLVGTCAVPIPR